MPPRPRRPVFHWGIFVWGEHLMLAVCIIAIFVVPRFEDTLSDFKLELPPSTRILLAVARGVTMGGFVVLLAIPVGIGFLSAQLEPGGRRALRMLITVMMAGFVLFTVFALFEPMRLLIEGMSSGKR